MDEKIIAEAMDNRFDGVESCVIVEELLELEAYTEILKEDLAIMTGNYKTHAALNEEYQARIEQYPWILVSERLPTLKDACAGQGERGCRDGTVDVIGLDANGFVFGANYYPKMKVWNFSAEPIYWMPIILPEQAKAEEILK